MLEIDTLLSEMLKESQPRNSVLTQLSSRNERNYMFSILFSDEEGNDTGERP